MLFRNLIVMCVLFIVAAYSLYRYVEYQVQFRPERVENPSGWEPYRVGGGITVVGEFVLKKGESTDNGKLGVKVLDITPGPPSPPYVTNIESDGSKAVLRFYNATDQSVICDFTDEASSTGSDTRYICGGKLPFSNLRVEGIDSKEGWVYFSFHNLDEAAKSNP
jgi:hypothetical protein